MRVKKVKLGEYFMLTEDRYLVDFTCGEVYELNLLGYEVIVMLRDGMEMKDIVKSISAKYSVPVERVEEDVVNFLKMLEEEGIAEVVWNEHQ
ncbi:MAG: PqqD family protein [Thermoplasmata archaeon]|nr:PqqD family protein [Thermoplasmata archaeon]